MFILGQAPRTKFIWKTFFVSISNIIMMIERIWALKKIRQKAGRYNPDLQASAR